MIYAPMLIPTLCRDKHFINCMESLRKNTWAKHTEIYIGLDYPCKESHWDGYNKICEYLKGDFPEFKALIIEKREINFGSSANSRALMDLVFEKYDRYIRTDDDCVFSPNFLEYTDKCLEEFEDDDEVIAVCGYNYPWNWKISDEKNIFKMDNICPSWGVGFWKDKIINIREQITNRYFYNNLDSMLNSKNISRYSNKSLEKIAVNVLSISEKSLTNSCTDIALSLYTVAENKKVILPKISKARNMGMDGSGVYCGVDDTGVYENQEIDQNYSFEPKLEYNFYDENFSVLNEEINRKNLLKVRIKITLCKILGTKNMFSFLRLIGKVRGKN